MTRTSFGPWKFIQGMGSSNHWGLTLSLPQAIIIGFCKQHRSRWDNSSWAILSGSGHMWESQVLLTDGQVVFLCVLRFSPTFDEWSARYKWNILERAVKPKSKKKKKKKKIYAIWLSVSTLHINFFPRNSLFLEKKAVDKCCLKFETERVNHGARSGSRKR